MATKRANYRIYLIGLEIGISIYAHGFEVTDDDMIFFRDSDNMTTVVISCDRVDRIIEDATSTANVVWQNTAVSA